ncbi:MAG: aminoglycoside phosphotransferase family protein [Mycobacteriaceae bacterium]|nr:aminoglycoside phosphotransferase family protein [Mycobacteriaceae bacterium]MBV9640317.1 aminoglycoside phosphotransferase family protein [Mycobacteriaceae bacterium]
MPAKIPRRPTDVTSAWLSTVLGVEITAVDITAIGTGQTGATYRISATYTRGQAGLPDTFVIKLPAQDDAVRDRVALGYRSEVAFYERVAQQTAVPTPHCFYCDISDDGADFALLLADMAPAAQGDQVAGCTALEARLAVTALAGLHGPSWCDPAWLGLDEVAMPKPGDENAARGLGDVARLSAEITLDKLGAQLSPADSETLTAAMNVVTPWLLAEPGRYSLMHGDYRLDNMLFDPDRSRVTIVDWQTMGIGLPARDLAYFGATSLLPETRTAIEGQLVGDYHRSLLTHGITDYDREMCWRDYRLGMLQAPLLASLGFAFAASTERGDAMVAVMLQRGCRAIRELKTLDLVSDFSTG